MARRAEDPRGRWLVADQNSGLSDDAIATSFADWLDELDELEPLHLELTAAQTLAEARAAGEV